MSVRWNRLSDERKERRHQRLVWKMLFPDGLAFLGGSRAGVAWALWSMLDALHSLSLSPSRLMFPLGCRDVTVWPRYTRESFLDCVLAYFSQLHRVQRALSCDCPSICSRLSVVCLPSGPSFHKWWRNCFKLNNLKYSVQAL